MSDLIAVLPNIVSTLPVKTPQAFEKWEQSQYSDRVYEFIGGKIVVKPLNVLVATLIPQIIGQIYVATKGLDVGWMTTSRGGYRVMNDRYAPHIGFMRYDRQRRPDEVGWNTVPPSLAIEMVMTTKILEQKNLHIKVNNYMLAGTMVLIVDERRKEVELYTPNQTPIFGNRTSKVSFGDVIPNFVLDYGEGVWVLG